MMLVKILFDEEQRYGIACYSYVMSMEMIRHVIDSHNDPIPAVLEIPSKECPYDASKDSILRRAKVRY